MKAQGAFRNGVIHRIGLAVMAAVLTTALFSCGGDSGTGPDSKNSVAVIKLIQSADTIEMGETSTITATFLNSAGDVVVPSSVAWSVGDSVVAAVSSSGVVTGRFEGTTTITVTANGVKSSLPVTVTAPSIIGASYPTTSFAVAQGDTLAIPRPALSYRSPPPFLSPQPSPKYTTSSPNITVSSTGVVKTLAVGSATVTATIDTITIQLTILVTPRSTAQIKLLPAVLNMGVRHTIATQASAYDATGKLLGDKNFTYTIDNPSVASVTASGIVAATGPGKATLTISNASTSLTVPVSVARLAPGAFTIDVRFVGTVSSAIQQATIQAAERWEQVISAPLVPYPFSITSGECGKGIPAVSTAGANLIVVVQVDSIDGRSKTVGTGGPCVIRDDAPQLTALGTMIVDSADAVSLNQQGILVDMITHEMGHILGIGTLWGTDWFPNTATGIGGTDPQFIGHAARVASAQLGFTADSAFGVPLDNVGGEGTRDAHWRAAFFGHELMTGTLHAGLNPLSLVTIEALADLGYTVVPEAADDLSSFNANSPPFSSGSLGVGTQINDAVVLPRFTVSRSGSLRAIHRGRNAPASDGRQ